MVLWGNGNIRQMRHSQTRTLTAKTAMDPETNAVDEGDITKITRDIAAVLNASLCGTSAFLILFVKVQRDL